MRGSFWSGKVESPLIRPLGTFSRLREKGKQKQRQRQRQGQKQGQKPKAEAKAEAKGRLFPARLRKIALLQYMLSKKTAGFRRLFLFAYQAIKP